MMRWRRWANSRNSSWNVTAQGLLGQGSRDVWGGLAIVGALVMSGNAFSEDPNAHLLGWAAVLAAGLAINYSALIYWFLCDSDVRRNPVILNPALDAIPPLAVGGILAICLIFREEYT